MFGITKLILKYDIIKAIDIKKNKVDKTISVLSTIQILLNSYSIPTTSYPASTTAFLSTSSDTSFTIVTTA